MREQLAKLPLLRVGRSLQTRHSFGGMMGMSQLLPSSDVRRLSWHGAVAAVDTAMSARKARMGSLKWRDIAAVVLFLLQDERWDWRKESGGGKEEDLKGWESGGKWQDSLRMNQKGDHDWSEAGSG